MKAILSSIINLFFYSLVAAQPGCTDPQALNFNPEAMFNDGSCTYAITEYVLQEITLLPEDLHECSGVEWLESGLWIHNDAGNPDKIYRIDSTSGAILQTITLAGADNIDWEDITEDEYYIYIGDFGNNIGNRTDLRIYRIQKSELINNVVNTEVIDFNYSDQISFEPGGNDHDFDCEAFIVVDDSIHLFTKNWSDDQTRHYSFPALPGNYSATFVEQFDAGGLITGADITEEGEIVLIGYTKFGLNFMWLLFDYEGSYFFSGNKRRVALGTGLENSQTEGVTLRDDGYGYICSEAFRVNNDLVFPQKLLAFSINDWIGMPPLGISALDDSYRIAAYPNPFRTFVEIKLSKAVDQWRITDSLGRTLQTGTTNGIQQFKFSTSNWISGTYYFEITHRNSRKSILLCKL